MTSAVVRLAAEARDERRRGRLLDRLGKVRLPIIDGLGFVPPSTEPGRATVQLFWPTAAKSDSTTVAAHPAFSEWAEVFGNEKMTAARLGRPSLHARILAAQGVSCRTLKRRGRQQ